MARILFIATLCLLGASVIAGAMSRDEIIKIVLAKADECKVEVGATPTDIDEMLSHKLASTKEGKCLRACISKKFEVMDANGKFNKAGALEKSKMITDNDPTKMKLIQEILDACASIDVPADHCEAADAYGKCFLAQIKAKGINEDDM